MRKCFFLKALIIAALNLKDSFSAQLFEKRAIIIDILKLSWVDIFGTDLTCC
jgi:hypothetical protein